MKTIIRWILGLGLFGLVACDNGNQLPIFSDFQSCVDFGAGCDPRVFESFRMQTGVLTPYAMTADGVLAGAVPMQGGLVFYEHFNGCQNNSSISTIMNGNIRTFIPVVLPRNGGLACMDSRALFLGNPNFLLNNPIIVRAEEFLFSELHMYGFTPELNQIGWGGIGAVPPQTPLLTKGISIAPNVSGTGFNNNGNWNVASLRANTSVANLLVGCDLRLGMEANPDCRSQWSGQGRCIQPPGNFNQSTGFFGLCSQ